jgi:hypothetical protein
MNTITNTHYNVIDTLIYAFGRERWARMYEAVLCIVLRYVNANASSATLALAVRENVKDDPDFQGSDMTLPVLTTLVDCVIWSQSEGRTEVGCYGELPVKKAEPL